MTTNPKGKITKAQLSKSLIDDLLETVSGGSVAIKKHTDIITSNTSRVYIGNKLFDFKSDQLLVFKNSVYLEIGNDYILNEDDYTISPLSGMWEASIKEPDTFNFICLINTPNGALFSGSKILNESITEDKLSLELQEKLNTGSRIGDRSCVSHSYIETVYISDWSSSIVNTDNMYTKTVTHGLNCNDNLIVYAIDTDTKRNITVSYKVIDENTIEVESDIEANIELMVIDSNELRESLTGVKTYIDDSLIKEVTSSNNEVIMTSPNGIKYKLEVSDTGELSTIKI